MWTRDQIIHKTSWQILLIKEGKDSSRRRGSLILSKRRSLLRYRWSRKRIFESRRGSSIATVKKVSRVTRIFYKLRQARKNIALVWHLEVQEKTKDCWTNNVNWSWKKKTSASKKWLKTKGSRKTWRSKNLEKKSQAWKMNTKLSKRRRSLNSSANKSKFSRSIKTTLKSYRTLSINWASQR